MFYSYFAALGYDVAVEESSSHGRLDMAVRTAGHVYLFEFKVAEMAPPGSALAQLQQRRYADKYRAAGEPIHLIGVEFSRATRNITAFEVAGRLTAAPAARPSAAVSAAGRGPAPARAGSGPRACTSHRPAPGSRCPSTAAAAPPPGSRAGTS